MNLYYFRDPVGNFGDDLNPWLWPKLLPGLLEMEKENVQSNTIFVGIGTLINERIPDNPHKIVFGAGVGYGEVPDVHNGKWDIVCVRGPLSAEKLKIPKEKGITDGAALLLTIEHKNIAQLRDKISFMSHRKSAECGDWKSCCHSVGINYIDPRESVDYCLQEIRSSSLLITEAMHGAIVSDLFRVPWIPVRSYSHLLDFKWVDWCKSLNLEYSPTKIPKLWRREFFTDMEKWYYGWEKSNYMKLRFKIHKITGKAWATASSSYLKDKIGRNLLKLTKGRAFLSDEKTMNIVVERMKQQLELFKKKYHLL